MGRAPPTWPVQAACAEKHGGDFGGAGCGEDVVRTRMGWVFGAAKTAWNAHALYPSAWVEPLPYPQF